MNKNQNILKNSKEVRMLLLSALALSILPLLLLAEPTFVKGPVSGDWYEDGSPYIVSEGNIWVEQNDTLWIHESVEIFFTDDDSLVVYGTLITDNLVTRLTKFAQYPGSIKSWGGIHFIGIASSNSELKFCEILDAVNSISISENSSPLISHNYIEPIYIGIKVGAGRPDIIADTIKIDSTYTKPNLSYGIKIDGNPHRTKIDGCYIDIFVKQENYSHVITAYGIVTESSNISLTNNYIHVGSRQGAIGLKLSNSDYDTLKFNEVWAYSQSDKVYAAALVISCNYSQIINNTFQVNSPYKDNALYFNSGSNIVLMNNIVSGDGNSVGITIESTSNPVLPTYNDFYNHDVPCLGIVLGPTNYYFNPVFVSSPPFDLFLLDSSSPCIDAGNPEPEFNDPDGTRNDMGAHYFPQLNVSDNTEIPGDYDFISVHPNPTNSSSIFSFNLAKSSEVTVELYNTLGQSAGKLADGYFELGYYEIQIDMSGRTSGLYFIVLESSTGMKSQKILLLK